MELYLIIGYIKMKPIHLLAGIWVFVMCAGIYLALEQDKIFGIITFMSVLSTSVLAIYGTRKRW